MSTSNPQKEINNFVFGVCNRRLFGISTGYSSIIYRLQLHKPVFRRVIIFLVLLS